ncbi:membrane hypothetical protein [Vibrio crassostreae]|nr:membrane hypothetical protein [Vibrio chagasii]CAK2859874.1 membrane hypothetical protein [Vibrio crassostreae]
MTILGHQMTLPKQRFCLLYVAAILVSLTPTLIWGVSIFSQQLFNFGAAISTGAFCTMAGVRPTEKYGIPLVITICLMVGAITQGSYYLIFF